MVTDDAEKNELSERFPRQLNVTLPPWVNEPPPPFSELISAHDVARLTRRSRWTLSSLMLLGLFPKRRRYLGRPIGWLRADVLEWLSQGMSVGRESMGSDQGQPCNGNAACKHRAPTHSLDPQAHHRPRVRCSARRRTRLEAKPADSTDSAKGTPA